MRIPSVSAFFHSSAARSADLGDSRSSATSGGTPFASSSSRRRPIPLPGVRKRHSRALDGAVAEASHERQAQHSLSSAGVVHAWQIVHVECRGCQNIDQVLNNWEHR